MNKILSILAIWLCSIAAFAQLGSGDDWDLPGNPGVATSNITVSVNDAVMGSAEVTTATTYGAGVYPVGSTVSLVATPTTGYHFVSWSIDESSISTEATYSYVISDKDVTVKATFAPNKYSVVFEADGTVVQTTSQDFGSAITAPADPEKEGYTFRGWSPAVDATVPANDVTYTAIFDINKYNVTFTVEGADYSKSTLEYGTAIKAPEFPTKTGYTFGGWTIDETVPAHDVTYDGVYTINKYNVIFDANNGTENTVLNLDFGSAITAPADPEKTGYSFNGWTPAVDGAVVPANDITFTANWKVNAYKATFVVDEVPTELNFDFGAKIVAPADPTKEGYVFNGWSPAVAETMPAEDVTYTATWKLAKYNVSFVSDGKTISTSELEYGSAITAPADPTKEGYNFLGWNPAVDATVPAHDVTYTASFGKGAFLVTYMADGKVFATVSQDFGEPVALPEYNPAKEGHTFAGWEGYVEGATVPAENVTYNALWTVNKYNVVFVSGEETIKSESLDFGSAIIVPETPAKEGYSFDNWTPAVAETVPAQDVTYSATWKINKYNVTFDVDGKVYSTSSLEYGSAIEAPATTPVKEGYTFSAWGNFVEGATVPAEDVTYKAEWTANKYVVTFVSDGDTIKSESLDFASAIEVPANPTKEGYSFAGWTPAVAETVPANDVTYTASWEIGKFSVTFVDGNETLKSESLEFGASIIAPADPTKEGYTFAGWSPEVAATVPAENVVYSATWNINKYVVTFISDGDTIQSDTLEYIAAIKAPADPVKEGYVFTGWTPTVDDVVPSNDVTYTATWAVCKYTVAFVDGDETIKSESLDYGTAIVAPENPSKEGYTFTGWTPDVAATVPAEDVTYSATWSVNKYTVTFVVDGETVKTESVEYGAAIVAPENPSKSGYEFTGWSPAVAETMPAEDVTYTATWAVPVGIKTISLENAPEATYYTVNGVKVAKPTKAGLYIVNGVKMMIK